MFLRAFLFGVLATLFNSGAAQTTVNLPLGPGVANDHFAASVVNADACTTTYGLACTAGAFYIGSQPYPCDPNWTVSPGVECMDLEDWWHVLMSAQFLATYGPNSYRSLAQTQVGVFSGRTLFECSFEATTSAVCTVSASNVLNGYHTATSTTFTATGAAELGYHQIPVTAGASKLFPSEACKASANVAMPTGVVDVYKVLVVPGAAALVGAFA